MQSKLFHKKTVLLTTVILCVIFLSGCALPHDENGAIKLIEATTTFQETFSTENWFNAILVWPMAQFLNKLTPAIGVVGAIALLTILVNGVLLLMTLRQNIAQQQMQLIQPQLDRIQRKYEGRTDEASKMKQAKELNALYKKYNINPLGTIVTMFIQFPIIIAMYHAVQRSALLKSTPVMGLDMNVTPSVGILQMHEMLYLVIFIIMGLCQALSMYLPQWLAKKKAEKEAAIHHRRPETSAQSDQMKMMQLPMLLMILVFGWTWPTSMSIYWACYSVVNILKTLIVQKVIEGSQEKEGARA